MRLAITGDTHGAGEIQIEAAARELGKDDVLIILGDFGGIWGPNDIKKRTRSPLLRNLEDRAFTTAFIDGNHERFPLLNNLPQTMKWGSRVGKVLHNVFHLPRGYIYQFGSKTALAFGGAASIDRAYRTEGISWWPEEIPNVREYYRFQESAKAYLHTVNLVFTHTAPTRFTKLMGFRDEFKDPTQDFLDAIESEMSFDEWYFGHFHLDLEFSSEPKFKAMQNRLIIMEV